MKNDTTVTCRQGRGEHIILRDTIIAGHCNFGPSSHLTISGLSWSWSYGGWIYNYLCNQYLSPQRLWVRIPLRQGVIDTTLCDKVCQWLAAGRWSSPGTLVFSTNKTNRYDITEILLKVTLKIDKINLLLWLKYQIMESEGVVTVDALSIIKG
jgi:hypothetical protein